MAERVVAYARISTNEDNQKLSIANQKTYFQRELEKQDNAKFVKIDIAGLCDGGVYYDEGISGTKLKRRGFDRMLLDAGLKPIVDVDTDKATTTYKVAKKPLFDLIYVKDTTRFARNVNVNAILQSLKDNQVYVYFVDLGKSTRSSEDMTYIQLFFSFAERESRDKSRKVKFGYEEGVRQGKIYMGGKIIGYDYDKKTNTLRANPEEAKLVKLIFDLYTEEGLGHQMICNKLAELGYFNAKGNKYTRSTISRILENEKYTGVTNAGRYTKDDLFSKRHERDYNDPLRQDARKAQRDLMEQGIVKIEPIISVEQFQKAKEIRNNNCIANGVSCTYHGITDYARKIKCGCCGSWYISQSRKYCKEAKTMIRYYACCHRTSFDEYNGIPKCNNPSIREDKLDKLINSERYYRERSRAIESLIEMAEYYLTAVKKYIDYDTESEVEALTSSVDSMKAKRSRLVDLYADGIYDKAELEKKTIELTEEINKMSNRITELSEGNSAIYRKIEQIDELRTEARNEYKSIQNYIARQQYPSANRRALLRDIDYITIDEKGRAHFKFKSVTGIQECILRLGEDLEMYNELEELGWEEEIEMCEKESQK